MPDHLVLALLEALEDPAQAAAVAQKLRPFIQPSTPETDGWLDTKGAAAHLGMTPNALHKLTASRAIPFHQDAPKGKCWFLRSELDSWRSCGGLQRFAPAQDRTPQAA